MVTNKIRQWVSDKFTQPLTLGLTRVSAAGIRRFMLHDAAYEIFQRNGFHLLKKHYYLPIPDHADLDDSYWSRQSELVGLDMNEEFALALLDRLFPPYLGEFRRKFPLHREAGDSGFHLINGSFMAVDAHVYYCLIRHFKPSRIVEIGSGNSTMVAAAACLRNAEEGAAPHLTAVEPYPSPFLSEGLPGLSRLIEAKVQSVGMELFTSLEAGDILFIDSTHVLREGGDVQLEYCEILPRLAPGVIVHIHDISLPKPYPRVYFEDNYYYWNEQYLLQAFLAFNSNFEVMWAGNYLMLRHPERLRAAFPEFDAMREAFPMSEPTSFWMRVRPRSG
jgi:hypothetical protein